VPRLSRTSARGRSFQAPLSGQFAAWLGQSRRDDVGKDLRSQACDCRNLRVDEIAILDLGSRWAPRLQDLLKEIAAEREWFMSTDLSNQHPLGREFRIARQAGGVGRIAVRDEDDAVVAFACVWPLFLQYEGFSHVGRLSMGVAKPYRRQGIGRKLLEAVLAATKFERVELEVFEHNEAAIALYRKFGFETEGVKRNARFLDGKYMNIVLMARVNSQKI